MTCQVLTLPRPTLASASAITDSTPNSEGVGQGRDRRPQRSAALASTERVRIAAKRTLDARRSGTASQRGCMAAVRHAPRASGAAPCGVWGKAPSWYAGWAPVRRC